MSPLPLTRRRFLGQAFRLGIGLGAAGLLLDPAALSRLFDAADAGDAAAADLLQELVRSAPRARFWTSPATAATSADCLACHAADDLGGRLRHDHDVPGLVKCLLCAQGCTIPPGGRGRCSARYNRGGELCSLVYGHPVAMHVDPIEKKPFYHFLPGRKAFSMATTGCALHCQFCQNWEISQARPEDRYVDEVPPGAVVRYATGHSVPVVAFTYNEPTVFCEYLLDIARAARASGLRTALISCGFMNEAPLREMCDCLDAIKIDLKGFSPAFYRDVCSAELAPVLRSIRQVARSGPHLELVNLVVPTLNDSDAMLDGLCRWVAAELGPDVPVHFTRFHPDYRLRHLPPTPVSTLERALATARRHGLNYAYIGNVPGHPGNNTRCPGCGAVLIRRNDFLIEENRLHDGRCPDCGRRIAGVWN